MILTQDVNMLTTFSCAFACTGLQSVNAAKYFENHFINYSTKSHIEVQASVHNIKNLLIQVMHPLYTV